MARAYTVGTIALTLKVTTKWLDNVLSHHRVAGVVQERQGIARRVAFDGLLQLALALRLIHDLDTPTPAALRLAAALTQTGGNHTSSSGLTISLDLAKLRSDLESRLVEAVEMTPVPRRGRPSR